jgi:hypothetical protein
LKKRRRRKEEKKKKRREKEEKNRIKFPFPPGLKMKVGTRRITEGGRLDIKLRPLSLTLI